MKERKYLKQLNRLLMILLSVFLISCSSDASPLTNGDAHVTEEMHETISNYLVTKNASMYAPTDKQFEVHRVYGTSEVEGIIHVYLWSYYSGFNMSTGHEEQSGHSLPALIHLKKNDTGYEVVKYQEPEDGSEWVTSLEKMFPKRYVQKAKRDAGNVGDLKKEMNERVKQWLDEM
jgi:hypothetical protein